MRRPICAFVVRIWQNRVFSWSGSNSCSLHRCIWLSEDIDLILNLLITTIALWYQMNKLRHLHTRHHDMIYFFVCCLAHRDSTVGFPVFQWCSSTPQGSPGVGRNTLFLSSPHLCFIIVFICDLFVSVMIHWWVRKPSRGPNNCMFCAMTEAVGEVGIP